MKICEHLCKSSDPFPVFDSGGLFLDRGSSLTVDIFRDFLLTVASFLVTVLVTFLTVLVFALLFWF